LGINKQIPIDNPFFDRLTSLHPFITVCSYANQDYVGIVQNRDDMVTTIYDYGAILDAVIKEKFLELGEVWWWESNRKIPINIFLKQEMAGFKSYIKTFNAKDVEVLFGPVVNLSEIAEKRVKRKSIQLVRSFKKTRS
jgi:hypothetical protein